MIKIATLVNTQNVLLSDINQRIILLFNKTITVSSPRQIDRITNDITSRVKIVKENQNEIYLIDKGITEDFFAHFLYDKEVHYAIKNNTIDLIKLDEITTQLLSSAHQNLNGEGSFDVWIPDYLSTISKSQETKKISELNTEIAKAAVSQNIALSTLHSVLLSMVFFGIIIVWVIVLRPIISEFKKIIELHEHDQLKIEYQARHDNLTGLLNRQSFDDIVNEYKNTRLNFAFLVLDVDKFKDVNDSYGHDAGDAILNRIASILSLDQNNEEKAFRIGGDEFYIFLMDVLSETSAKERAQKICNSCHEAFYYKGEKISFTLSIGLYFQENMFFDRKEAVLSADYALYHAKKMGGNSVCSYSDIEKNSIHENTMLVNEIKAAISKKEFEVYYQPIISASQNKIIGLEALARWQHNDRGVLSPNSWITVAEKYGLLTNITEGILADVENHITYWQNQAITPVQVSINITQEMLYFPNTALERVLSFQLNTPLEERFSIGIEVPESIFLDKDYDKIKNKLSMMKERGAKIILDDFGTGHATLAHLITIPFDTIKIDKFFTLKILNKFESKLIVEVFSYLTKRLKKEIICEGVETLEVLNEVRYFGCDNIQGFYYSPPLPFEKVTDLLLGDI